MAELQVSVAGESEGDIVGPGEAVEDEELDFEKLINAPLPKVPREITFTGKFPRLDTIVFGLNSLTDSILPAHWLAVEGVQPSIPQNPTNINHADLSNVSRNRAAADEAAISSVQRSKTSNFLRLLSATTCDGYSMLISLRSRDSTRHESKIL